MLFCQGIESSNIAETLTGEYQNGGACKEKDLYQTEIQLNNYSYGSSVSQITQRKKTDISKSRREDVEKQKSVKQQTSWRRILLLIIAITVHNIPGMRKIIL